MALGRRNLKPKTLIKKQRKLLVIKGVLAALALTVILGSIAMLSRVPEVTLASVSVEGNTVVSDTSIEELVREKLEGNYFFLFSRANMLIYPKGEIHSDILETFKRIKHVELKAEGLTALRILVEERTPHTLWCAEQVVEEVYTEACYFMDDTGFIYTEAPTFTGDVFFRYYELEPKEDPVGEQFVDLAEYQKLTFIVEQLRRLKLSPVELKIEKTSYVFHLTGGGRIIVNPEQDAFDIIDNLNAVLEAGTLPDPELALDYIDLRFGNKIYYKSK